MPNPGAAPVALGIWPQAGKMGRKRKAPKFEKVVWSEEKMDKLIELYEENVHLYDKTTKGYSKRDKKEATFAAIAAKLETTGKYFIIATPMSKRCNL